MGIHGYSAMALFCAAAVAAGGTARGQTAGGGQEAKAKPRTLRIISDFEHPPLAYKEKGKRQGFEVELGEAIGKELGARIEWIEKPFSISAYRSALDGKTADAAMSNITITEKRAEVISFSKPYLTTSLAVAVQDDVEWEKSTFSSGLRRWKIGVMRGTTGEEWARKDLSGDVDTYTSLERLVQALKNVPGKSPSDETGFCILHDRPSLLWALSEYGYRFKIVEDDFGPQAYGIAVRKGNKELLSDLNRALGRLIAGGVQRKLKEKWTALAQERDLPEMEERDRPEKEERDRPEKEE